MTQIFIDEENIEERYAQGLYEDYLKEKTEKLQSNWNSLREWLKENEDKISYMEDVIDKMSELEGKDNNGIVD